MANKRSHRGRRAGLPRFFYFPWEEKDRRVRRERELAREAKRWNEDRIRRFEKDQRRKREYISFVEIAEWYSDLAGPVSPKKAAALREQAYRMLESDLLERRFEEDGRFVLFLHPGVSLTHWKMTAKWYQQARENNLDNEQGRSYLRHCWLPRSLFEDWCAWHNLPKSPPRFQPQESHPVLAATARDETAAIKALASYLKANNQLKRAEANDWCRKSGYDLAKRAFDRVWPEARERAGLGRIAPPGRKKKLPR